MAAARAVDRQRVGELTSAEVHRVERRDPRRGAIG